MYIVCPLTEREGEGLYIWVSYMMHMCRGIYVWGILCIDSGDDPVFLIFQFEGEGFGFCSFVWMDVDIFFWPSTSFFSNQHTPICILSLPLLLPLNTFQKYTHTPVRKARKSAQAYFREYRETKPVGQLVKSTASVMQEYTQSGGVRPFGVSLLVAGMDGDGVPRLFQVDPSGAYFGWKATAIGKVCVLMLCCWFVFITFCIGDRGKECRTLPYIVCSHPHALLYHILPQIPNCFKKQQHMIGICQCQKLFGKEIPR